jgi:Zn-dependent protease with chaperone function
MTDFDPVPIPGNTAAAVQFANQGELIWLGLQLIAVAVPLAFLATGWGGRLRAGLDRGTGGRRWLTLILFAWIFLAAETAASAPLHYLDEVWRWERWRAYGFPPPEAAGWWLGQILRFLATGALATALLWLPFRLIARRPRWWPFILTGIALPLMTAGLVFSQVVLMPATTRFEPMQDRQLFARIEDMAQRCGAGAVPVLIGGNDTTVVGLGGSSRILIGSFDLKLQSRRQVLTTVAHELKHYRMGDNWLAMAVVGALMLAGALLVQLAGSGTVRLWGPRLGISTLYDPAALPLMALILAVAWTLAGLPLYNAVQKHAEHEADRFALELTHDNRAFAEWQARAGSLPWRINQEDWITALFLDNHPSQADRVRFGNSYRPWAAGRPGVYDRVCKPRERTP